MESWLIYFLPNYFHSTPLRPAHSMACKIVLCVESTTTTRSESFGKTPLPTALAWLLCYLTEHLRLFLKPCIHSSSNTQFDFFTVWLTKFPRDQVNSYGVNLQVSWRKIWLLDSNIGPNSNWICLNDFFVGWHRSWISEMAKITTIYCKKSNFRSNFKNIFINKPVINFGLFSPHTREIIW